jgi:hypothetical protein
MGHVRFPNVEQFIDLLTNDALNNIGNQLGSHNFFKIEAI